MADETPIADPSSSSKEHTGRESSLIEVARCQAFRREGGDIDPSSGGFGEIVRASVPPRIGRYRIQRRISSGGMGTVYEAEQEAPRRTVAIKVIHAGGMSPRALRRFQYETRVLAHLQHPGIAQIFETGTFESAAGSHPFFSMEFVAGDRLLIHAELKKLSLDNRLELMVKICGAVQHAHLKGVIHRDLKPANILVDRSGQPKVLDFGVARATDADVSAITMHTQRGEPVGTVPYMSPEQVAGDPDDIDTRSDVYSLGVVCYELLSGEHPYDVRGKSIPDALRIITQEEPPRLGTLHRSLRGDLETMVAKAMEKDRQRRYQSAAEFAADIRRYLRGEPIQARPVGRAGRLWRWCRREPRVAALAALLLALLIAMAVGSTGGTLWIAAARRAEQHALRQAQQLGERRRRSLYAAEMNLAMQSFRRNDFAAVLALLETQRPKAPEEDLRGFEWYYLWRQLHRELYTLRGHQGSVQSVAISSDGRLIASGGSGGAVFLWDLDTRSPRALLPGHDGPVHAVAFSPQGDTLASGGEDGFVKLWDVATGRQQRILRAHAGPVQCLAFHPQGRLLASGGGVINRFLTRMENQPGHVIIWDLSSGREFLRLPELANPVAQLVFSPDGRTLAAAAWGGTAHSWEVPAGEPVELGPADVGGLMTLALSPDGSRVALAGWGENVVIWDIAAGRVGAVLSDERVGAVAFSPDGKLLAAANRDDGCVRLWDVQTGRELELLRGHTGAVNSIAFNPQTGRLITGSSDGTLKVWDPNRRYRPLRLQGHEGEISDVAFSPDGKTIATAGRDGTARIWDRDTGRELSRSGRGPRWVQQVVFFPDGKTLAFPKWNNIWVVDVRSGDRIVVGGFPTTAHAVAVSSDGRFLAAGGLKGRFPEGRGLKVFSTSTWQVHWAYDNERWVVVSLAFSPDGRLLAVGGSDGAVRLFDAATGEERSRLTHTGWIMSLAFSPDGTRLAAGSWPKDQPQSRPAEVVVWDPTSGKRHLFSAAHHEAVASVAFSPDGKTLATGGGRGVVKLWDLTTGDVRATFEMPQTGWVHGLAFSPDGKTLACTSGSTTEPGQVILLEAASERELSN